MPTDALSVFKKTDHEVFVLTGEGVGFTATWVLPASLISGTPRLLVLAAPENHSVNVILGTGRFVLHLLAADQAELMARFGLGSSRDQDKFAGLSWQKSPYGPILAGTAGYHFCELVQTFDIGERLILIGDVKGGQVDPKVEPLKKRAAFAALPEATRAALLQKQIAMGLGAAKLFKDFSS